MPVTPWRSRYKVAEYFVPTGWRNETTLTVTPSTPDPVLVTDLALGPDDDTIWVQVTTTGSQECPWPWSYALLTWVSSEGRELGSTTIHGPCEGEVFRIGNGRQPVDRAGSIRLYPRSWNLRWVDLGNPWTLNFKFETGQMASGPVDFGSRATLAAPAVPRGNAEPDYTLLDGFAWIVFNFLLK